MSSHNHAGWGTHGNISYGHPSVHPYEGSISYYQEQFQQSFDEELFHALKDEINRDNEALQRRFPSTKPRWTPP